MNKILWATMYNRNYLVICYLEIPSEFPPLVRESIRVPNKFCEPHDKILAEQRLQTKKYEE
tara:strand:- start:38063 stop:38245 length:183 start_codon:yes stop_codon:yes gene_type:complete